MATWRIFLVWALAWWAQLLLAPLLRWLEGFPDVLLLAWLAVALVLRGRAFWVWTLIWGFSLGWISGLPDWVPLMGYLMLGLAWWWVRRRLWERPYLLLFAGTLMGTMTLRLWEYGILNLLGTSLPWRTGISRVVMPSLLWNLLLALPVYTVVTAVTGRPGGEEL